MFYSIQLDNCVMGFIYIEILKKHHVAYSPPHLLYHHDA